MKDKKILYGIIIAFIFLLSIGLTYAYFSVTTNVVGERKDIKASVGTLSILYTDGPEITADDIQPGWTTTKTVKVENTGTLKAFYSIDWASFTNEITNDELVLSTTCSSSTDTCNGVESTPVTDSELVVGVGIDPGEEQTYVITFEFKEISSAQNYNQDKKFNGVLNVYESPEAFTLMGTLLDSNGDPIEGATMEIHSTVRTGVTDVEGKFNINSVAIGTHEVIFKNSSNVTIATDTVSLLSGKIEGVSGKNITGDTDEGKLNLQIKLSGTSTIEEIKVISTLKYKILSYNTVYPDNASSPHTASYGIDFRTKSSLTNGQGLYTNNRLEDGKNTYFRGGSFCAYANYTSETSTGTRCVAAGGTWSSYTCSLDLNRAACQSKGLTYYDLNNNVTFAGHKWKIIRIDENDNIRMIFADTSATSVSFNSTSTDNAYVGYMYGTIPSTSFENAHTNTNNSAIKTYAENWYATNLLSYSSYISDAGYCNDRNKTSGLGYDKNDTVYASNTRSYEDYNANPRLNLSSSCSSASRDLFTTSSSEVGNKLSTYPIGLLTADEAKYAGMVRYSSGVVNQMNYQSYLKFGSNYWTMSPLNVVNPIASNIIIGIDASLLSSSVAASSRFRPVISLKSNIIVASGTGTYDDPFVIQ